MSTISFISIERKSLVPESEPQIPISTACKKWRLHFLQWIGIRWMYSKRHRPYVFALWGLFNRSPSGRSGECFRSCFFFANTFRVGPDIDVKPGIAFHESTWHLHVKMKTIVGFVDFLPSICLVKMNCFGFIIIAGFVVSEFHYLPKEPLNNNHLQKQFCN